MTDNTLIPHQFSQQEECMAKMSVLAQETCLKASKCIRID